MASAAFPRKTPGTISAASFRDLVARQSRSGPGAAYRALGRMKPGEMNRTEERFDAFLRAQTLAGAVLWHAFQGIKLRLADKTFLTTDFAVLPADCVLQMVDVKGARHLVEEDAKVKMKVAAKACPFRFFYAFPRGAGGFDLEEIGA